MQPVTKGIYRLRLADGPEDVIAAQRLRYLAFGGGAGTGRETGLDRDGFDSICTHAMVEDLRSGQLVCCFRMLDLADGR
ncbi:MAG: GNAT family N-acetyltransferase, partial [Paracoccaceae bacterium]|nr:GNAT family N-acetyltransferase [Paracoccaceae bacterium]